MIGCDFGSCVCGFVFSALSAMKCVPVISLCSSSLFIILVKSSFLWYGMLLIVSLCFVDSVVVSLVVCWW